MVHFCEQILHENRNLPYFDHGFFEMTMDHIDKKGEMWTDF